MKNNNWMLILGAVIVLGALYYFFMMDRTSPTDDTMMEETTTTGSSVVLDEQNASGETGTVSMTEENGQVTVVISLIGAPETAQPAHIHTGSCPTPGAVVYPLSNVVNGVSSTVLDVSMDDLISQQPLAINVHQSATALNEYVACGDLAL
ncbi:MAG: CHRD domain-containing protein [Candidatus Roizmanbacteria bacterium]|nr:CHRD domain-containing protein [Candidatus Roizmanbacteria bacterium]